METTGAFDGDRTHDWQASIDYESGYALCHAATLRRMLEMNYQDVLVQMDAMC